MDSHMPDLTDDFDFDEFLNFPPEQEPPVAGPEHFLNFELNSSLNFQPQPAGCHDNNHGNDGLWADSDSLLSPPSTNLLSLSSVELDTTRDSAGSNGHSLPCNKNTSLHEPNANMATISQCNTIGDAQAHGEPSIDTAEIAGSGVLQQVTTPALQSSNRRLGVHTKCTPFKPRADCDCLACIWLRSGLGTQYHQTAPKNEAHSSIQLCEHADCENRYGIRRVPDTEHLFTAQICHGRNVRCRCAAQACNFVCNRWNDLQRHHATKHCIKPERYPCPDLFCVYGGENGFKRLDKLKDHHRKVHEGKLRPVQGQRPIKSAATKPAVD